MLIDQFGLYEDLKASQPVEAVIDRMRKNISVDLKSATSGGPTVAFSVSYQGSDANRVATVTNTLASLYIEENLKVRDEQASSTSQFFKVQGQLAKEELQKIEQQMSDLKRARGRQVPDQEQQQMMRDHESRTEIYRSLLNRQWQADLAASMERRQMGEQFRIVDPAFPSEVPASPNRPLLWAIAFLVALGVAGAVSIRPRRLARLTSPPGGTPLQSGREDSDLASEVRHASRWLERHRAPTASNRGDHPVSDDPSRGVLLARPRQRAASHAEVT